MEDCWEDWQTRGTSSGDWEGQKTEKEGDFWVDCWEGKEGTAEDYWEDCRTRATSLAASSVATEGAMMTTLKRNLLIVKIQMVFDMLLESFYIINYLRLPDLILKVSLFQKANAMIFLCPVSALFATLFSLGVFSLHSTHQSPLSRANQAKKGLVSSKPRKAW